MSEDSAAAAAAPEETKLPPEALEIKAKVATLAEEIKAAKTAKKPKEEWEHILKEMLDLKTKYKEVTGVDFDPPKKDSSKKKPKGGGGDGGQQEASEKNKEKNAKKAAAKAAKEAKKLANRLEREKRERLKAEKLAGKGQDNFGDAPLIKSDKVTDNVWTNISKLDESMDGKEALIRGHVQTSRLVGKGAFSLVRSSLYSVQCVAFEGKEISHAMVQYIAGLPPESVVDVKGVVTVTPKPITSATQSNVELHVKSCHCVSKATAAMPFQMEDACRPDATAEEEAAEEAAAASGEVAVRVGQDVRLDNRWVDLRTPANQSIFRIESWLGKLFRDYLFSAGFTEVHTPKLIGGSSEGGADVFTLDYFGKPACLAMSPQLHKQMSAACSGFERVFVTGPVFRAEDSNTRRHLCEFTGLDLEMTIVEHYDEVLSLFDELFRYIFDGINKHCKDELERVREQHPFEDLKYLTPTLRLTYAEGCQLLRDAGVEQDDYEDLSTENEKKLGDIVKEKYDTDFFFMDQYPLSVRPFYTMPSPSDPKLSNSYDFFVRGQEILSGAQRIHDPDLLVERAKAWDIDVEDMKGYIDSFRNGAMPHGGGGIGLERVVMLFLDLKNIRKASWFPRDPKRLQP